MPQRLFAGFLVAAATLLVAALLAEAQSSTFSQTILSLQSRPTPTGLEIDNARLFGGSVRAVITDQTGVTDDFAGADVIAFRIVPRTASIPLPAGEGFTTDFVGTRADFERWACDNAADLLRVLFPGGVSAGAT
jgi:hypothetical protein